MKPTVDFCKPVYSSSTGQFDVTLNCCTITLWQKFKCLFDPVPYFYRSNWYSTDDPLSDIDAFSNFVDNIVFVCKSKKNSNFLLSNT